MNWTPPPGPRHWHLTRDIKDRGKCAACDLVWADYDRSDQHAETGKAVTEPPENGP